MKMLEWEIKRLDDLFDTVIDQLDPDVGVAVCKVLDELGGRFTPYCGFRNAEEQAKAKAGGSSNASFGESPHNYRPALACDVVLNPAVISCRPHPKNADYPDLWDDGMPRSLNGVVDGGNKEAAQAWLDLELAAKKYNLERVNLRAGVRDMPHLQKPGWQSLVVGRKPG